MPNLTPFQFETNQIRVVTGENGEPLFVARDVAKALGYADCTQAIRVNCKHAKSLKELGAYVARPHQKQALTLDPQTKLIPESDVYRLTMKSTLPSAERFQDWLAEDVIPAIRKTGSYRAAPQRTVKADPVRDLLAIGRAVAKVHGVNPSLAMAYTLDGIQQATGLPTDLIRKALPSVAPEDLAALNATQVGEHLGMNARATNALLESLGLQARDASKQWVLTDAGTAQGEMKPFHRNGHSGYDVRWKPTVIDVLRTFMAQQGSSDATPSEHDDQAL